MVTLGKLDEKWLLFWVPTAIRCPSEVGDRFLAFLKSNNGLLEVLNWVIGLWLPEILLLLAFSFSKFQGRKRFGSLSEMNPTAIFFQSSHTLSPRS